VKGIDAGDCVLALPADVTQAVDLDRLMNEAQARFGTLDGVSANAGAGMTDHCADCPA
jgi:NAD(P)-dependent dehydrogenase (short-subunit alcohol dehydrogenase family)